MTAAISSTDPHALMASRLAQRAFRTEGYMASWLALKHLNRVSGPSCSLPVGRSALAKQSRAPGQAHPAGRLKVATSRPNLALPLPKTSRPRSTRLTFSRLSRTRTVVRVLPPSVTTVLDLDLRARRIRVDFTTSAP